MIDTICTAVINTHYDSEVVLQLTPWKATLKVDAMSSVANDTIGTAVINTHYFTKVVQQLAPWKATFKMDAVSTVARHHWYSSTKHTLLHKSSSTVSSMEGDVNDGRRVNSSE